jgi:creatinine amidohydrolase
VIASLFRGGFRTVVFVNGHGGNVATVNAAFSEVLCEFSIRTPPAYAACCLELHNFYEGTSFRTRAEALYGRAEGLHVTASEVAMTQCLFPAEFANRIGVKETPQVAPTASGFYDAEDYRRRYPDGRIASDPSLSRPEHGAELLDCAVEDLVARVNELRAT